MVKRICQTSSNFGFYKEWIVFSTSVDVTVLNEIKFFLSFIWERMLTMFWLVFVPIKYFLQWKFLCNSFCWFNFQFRSDGDRVYVHSARNNFIKYHWIVFTKYHFVTTYTPLSGKKKLYCFPDLFTSINFNYFEFTKVLIFSHKKKVCTEIHFYL